MFTAGRILRRKHEEAAAIFDDRLASSARSRQRRKFRCYVPFVRHSLLATVAGLVVMATGAAFCIAGFYTEHPSSQHHQQQSDVDQSNNVTEVLLEMHDETFNSKIFMKFMKFLKSSEVVFLNQQ